MNADLILTAAARLDGHVRVTPFLHAPALDEIAGRPVFVKPECLQHTGSFKFRGGWNALSALPPDIRRNGVIAYSSGNHAQGVANAAAFFGVPAVIVMPSDAPRSKIDDTRALGAEVVLYDRPGGESREDIGRRIADERHLTLIPPYDHEDVIAGQGTTGLEIAEQAAALGIADADVLICCGGGGLTAGIALALKDRAPGLRARPCEPEGFDDTARSLASGEICHNQRQSGSLCDAIVTPAPGQLTFPILKQLCGPGLVVSEEDALRAMALAFAHLKIVVEPGGAVALAAALFHPEEISTPAAIAVCTGGNVDPSVFRYALDTLT